MCLFYPCIAPGLTLNTNLEWPSKRAFSINFYFYLTMVEMDSPHGEMTAASTVVLTMCGDDIT